MSAKTCGCDEAVGWMCEVHRHVIHTPTHNACHRCGRVDGQHSALCLAETTKVATLTPYHHPTGQVAYAPDYVPKDVAQAPRPAFGLRLKAGMQALHTDGHAFSPEHVEYVVKDSGESHTYESGMQRDTNWGKVDYSLVFDGPMLRRWAEHLTKGARKYEARNWMKATGQVELDRFRESAARHFCQLMTGEAGETKEDHLAAVFFNLNGLAYVEEVMKRKS